MDFIKSNRFVPAFNRDRVLEKMEFRNGSSSYKKASKMYDEVCARVIQTAHPGIWIKFTEEFTEGRPAAYCLMSMGREIDDYISECVDRHQSLKGLLADYLASAYIFQLDGCCKELVKAECAFRKCGVKARLEAPEKLPPEAPGQILSQIERECSTGISVSEGGVFYPPRTQCYILLLSKDEKCFRAGHDCINCKAKNCRWKS